MSWWACFNEDSGELVSMAEQDTQPFLRPPLRVVAMDGPPSSLTAWDADSRSFRTIKRSEQGDVVSDVIDDLDRIREMATLAIQKLKGLR